MMFILRRLMAWFDRQLALALGARIEQTYLVECFGPDGRLKWSETIHNLVVTVGLNDILDKYWKGSAYSAAHYIFLKGAGSVVAGDTMASHSGWSEVTVYSQAARPTLTWGTVSGGSVAATAAEFSMNDTYTVAGAGITTNATKGGTSGTLVGAGDFSTSRSGGSGDTINVTPTSSLTAS